MMKNKPTFRVPAETRWQTVGDVLIVPYLQTLIQWITFRFNV
jgi:hypothetical protein